MCSGIGLVSEKKITLDGGEGRFGEGSRLGLGETVTHGNSPSGAQFSSSEPSGQSVKASQRRACSIQAPPPHCHSSARHSAPPGVTADDVSSTSRRRKRWAEEEKEEMWK